MIVKVVLLSETLFGIKNYRVFDKHLNIDITQKVTPDVMTLMNGRTVAYFQAAVVADPDEPGEEMLEIDGTVELVLKKQIT
jgi:hypothetical protein